MSKNIILNGAVVPNTWTLVEAGSEAPITDGRGYSIGRLLRERYAYQGELRAVGDVGRDHLFNLFQCGFNAFEIKPSQSAEQALAGLKDFTEGYQTSAARPVPLYRRRAHTPTPDSWATISAPS